VQVHGKILTKISQKPGIEKIFARLKKQQAVGGALTTHLLGLSSLVNGRII